MRRWLPGILLAIVITTGCTNINTPTPGVPTADLPPLATFTPRYTATPVPTSTLPPTFTATPSITAVPPTASNTPTPTPTPPILGRVSTVQDAVNMREGPNITFPAIVGVENNTDIVILSSNPERNWYNVRLEDGTEGWIASNLIFILPSPTPEPTLTAPGVVVQVSGTPLATALLGGLPVTATPSFTPGAAGLNTSVARTPGTITATPSATASPERGANIPTITPDQPLGPTGTPTITPTSIPLVATASQAALVPQATATTRATRAATSSPPTAGASGSAPVRTGFDVLAYCENFNERPPVLGAGSTIDVFWGWVASTPQYIEQHVNSVIYEVRFDGQLLENWRQYAGPVTQQPDGNWGQFWYVPILEPLTAGTHTITYRATWRTAIYDGYQQFGPGTTNEVDIGSCTFTVQ
ncbi:MAG: SH3 domain-containing protein [Anaerolineae bacterium]|nr:SH3 domain-containing protein [Anaerolineae bacterium]